MTKILAKQISNVVNTDSDQTISGKKTFENTVNFQKSTSAFNVVIEDGFIYWITNFGVLDEEGNQRIGVVNSVLTMEKYFEGMWQQI